MLSLGCYKYIVLLRYYACGSFQHVVSDSIGIDQSSVSRIVTRVTNKICQVRGRFIKFPRTREEITTTKQTFYDIAQFPNVIGAIDGSLISIQTPDEDEHIYVSRKGGHSINILAVCDGNLKFTYVVAKYPGATNDAFIWANCNLNEKFENGDIESGWLLGDSG